jgi:hypothetical protein
MFGTASEGRAGFGVFWEIPVSGAYEVLLALAEPLGAITIDNAGNAYGTNFYAGEYGGGDVWRDAGVAGHGPPVTVATAASANPDPVTHTKSNVYVLGAYAGKGGATTLTYVWSSTGPAPVTFAANGTEAARNTIATFSLAGSYTLRATIASPLGSSTTSSVSVTVNQTTSAITVTPGPTLTLGLQATQQFSATAYDQFGNVMSPQPVIRWADNDGSVGSISDSGGLFHTGKVAGSATVKAKISGVIGTCAVTVN